MVELIDVWTLGHVGFGVVGAILTKKLWFAAFWFAMWEFLEHSGELQIWWGDPSFLNGVADVVVAIVAMYVARLLITWAAPRVNEKFPWVRDAVEE